jgi:dipeptidyl-peptidase-4
MMAQKRLTLEDLNFGGVNYTAMSPVKKHYKWVGNELVESDGKPEKAKYPKVTTRDHNLYVQFAEGEEEVQLTHDGCRELVYGEAVHRNEWGIDNGIFMSPDRTKVAFYRMDQSMVTDYPQVSIIGYEARHEPDKYPMTGATSHKVTIGIIDLIDRQNLQPRYLDLGDVTDRYFTNISWAPDGKSLYLIELNRDQNESHLDAYDVVTGKKKATLFTERDEKYVEPLHPITFLPWDDSKYIYWSQKDGFWHLYLGSLNDKKGKKADLIQLTKGEWVVMSIIGFCEKDKSVIISANKESHIQRNLYRLDLSKLPSRNEGVKMILLDNGKGVHDGVLNDNGTMLLDIWTEPDVPRAYATINTRTGERKEVFTAPNPWEGYDIPIYRHGTLTAADGKTELHYRMVLPKDFDENKKYPAVVYVYGGPHAHNIASSWHWASRPWETYMAGEGYIVFVLDNRGSENRGKEFEQVIYRQMGQEEMKDQMKGVEFLSSLPYIDTGRLGVHGWSYGGYMTISLMTNYKNVFKVGVAGGPVIDWKWYEVMYGERYMDTPQDNPEGYAKCSLLSKAKDLNGKLLIITGYNDKTVVPQHCLNFIYECNLAGTYPDFYVFPGEEHNMKKHQSVVLHERITKYFNDYLK